MEESRIVEIRLILGQFYSTLPPFPLNPNEPLEKYNIFKITSQPSKDRTMQILVYNYIFLSFFFLESCLFSVEISITYNTTPQLFMHFIIKIPIQATLANPSDSHDFK